MNSDHYIINNRGVPVSCVLLDTWPYMSMDGMLRSKSILLVPPMGYHIVHRKKRSQRRMAVYKRKQQDREQGWYWEKSKEGSLLPALHPMSAPSTRCRIKEGQA